MKIKLSCKIEKEFGKIMNRFEVMYLAVMNILGFMAMGIDKKRAINKEWRISEKTLFLLSLLGGSLGTWSGMYLFHHKTKHWYFVIGMPAILIAQIVIVVYYGTAR